MCKRIADDRAVGEQHVLFPKLDDVPFMSANMASPYLGDWAEEFVAMVYGGGRLATQAGRLCPDVRLGHDVFAEVKAISNRRCFTMYKGRYDEYRKLVKQGTKLYFVLLLHSASASELRSRDHLRDTMPHCLDHLIVLPAQTVFREVRAEVEKHGGWMHAPRREAAYQDYVIIRGAWINHWALAKPHRPMRTFPTQVYGRDVGFVPFRPVRCSPGLPRAGWHEEATQEAASSLLAELQSERLEVGLFPTPDGRMVRKAISSNPAWYQAYVADSPSDTGRRRSVITRLATERALQRVADDRPIGEVTETRLRRHLKQRAEELKDEYVPF
jgi:hypothetical protein